MTTVIFSCFIKKPYFYIPTVPPPVPPGEKKRKITRLKLFQNNDEIMKTIRESGNGNYGKHGGPRRRVKLRPPLFFSLNLKSYFYWSVIQKSFPALLKKVRVIVIRLSNSFFNVFRDCQRINAGPREVDVLDQSKQAGEFATKRSADGPQFSGFRQKKKNKLFFFVFLFFLQVFRKLGCL